MSSSSVVLISFIEFVQSPTDYEIDSGEVHRSPCFLWLVLQLHGLIAQGGGREAAQKAVVNAEYRPPHSYAIRS